MKRKRILISLVLAAAAFAVFLAVRTPSLSEEERQQRAEDYGYLLDCLREVGYEEPFALKEGKAMEQNLRRLWLREPLFSDARKNAQLLVLLKNFDFLGEGLNGAGWKWGGANWDGVNVEAAELYYQNWPYSSRYVTASNAAAFSHEEVLWLMLLLPEEDLAQAQPGLRDVLAARGAEAFRGKSNTNIWPYFELHYPGYLEREHPVFWQERVDDEMAVAFHNADPEIQSRLIQGVDMAGMQHNISRPRLVLSFPQAEELLGEHPPQGRWSGGYLRVVEPEITGFGTQQPARTSAQVYEKSGGASLAAVTHPADARFAVYEEYTDKELYSTYYSMDGGDDSIDVYIWLLHIRIVDLITGEEIFSETKRGNPPPEEISITMIFRSATVTADGEYNYEDFDYDRYAQVMVAYMEENGLGE